MTNLQDSCAPPITPFLKELSNFSQQDGIFLWEGKSRARSYANTRKAAAIFAAAFPPLSFFAVGQGPVVLVFFAFPDSQICGALRFSTALATHPLNDYIRNPRVSVVVIR